MDEFFTLTGSFTVALVVNSIVVRYLFAKFDEYLVKRAMQELDNAIDRARSAAEEG